MCSNPTLRGLFGFIATLALILALIGLSSCAGGGSAQTSTPSAGTLTSNSQSVSFGNVSVGTAMTQQLSVTNTGTATVNISQVTVAGTGFGISSLSLPLTLTVGQGANLQVTFSPTIASTFSGSISVASNATNSPNIINLSGTGTTVTVNTTSCVGISLSETPTNVSAGLSESPGVIVTQLTGNGSNFNTYADVPAFSQPADLLTYNYSSPSAIATSNLDGTNAQVITGQQPALQATASIDGNYIFYQGKNPDATADIYAVPITQSGSCTQERVSNLEMTPIAPLGALQISPSSIDPATGLNVIAFSEGLILHRARGSGTNWTALPDINLPDPENANVFHRIRLNPVFPNILWWKRDAPNPNPNGVADPEIWVADLNASPITAYSVAGPGVAAGHPSWSANGLQIGYNNGQGIWVVANVLNADGSFNLVNGGFTNTTIGPAAATGLDANYCDWSPDGTVLVCTAGPVPGEVYLMSLDGSQTNALSMANDTGTNDDAVPKARFLDMQHIIFSSDRTGTSEVYVITGFTTTFP
jgi:hypothetical protein